MVVEMFRKLICLLVLMPSVAFAQGYPQPVLNQRTVAERTKKFEGEMQRLGFSGHIQSCSHMMLVAVGVRGGNLSYGAVCQIDVNGKTQSAVVCDDDLVGHFGLKAGTFVSSDDAIAEFTAKNCYGGG